MVSSDTTHISDTPTQEPVVLGVVNERRPMVAVTQKQFLALTPLFLRGMPALTWD